VKVLDDLAAVAMLTEPARGRLYAYVRDRHEPVGREEAARAVGISVKLAAFHLDRMVRAGMLDVEHRRLSGRAGPGAGRPAKLYRISKRRFAVTVPQTGYPLAASILAAALTEAEAGANPAVAVRRVAREVGERLGDEIREAVRDGDARVVAITRRLAELGFQPQWLDSGEMVLRNCIFAELAESHRDLICGMAGALVEGLLAGADARSLRAEGGVAQLGCCVRVRAG
jgi:predicted ArsR family transcriptional regulator